MSLDAYWHTGLYGCFEDVPACIDNTLCHACEMSRQVRAAKGEPDTYSLWALPLTICFTPMYYYLRRAVVNKYHIREHAALSAVTIVCCGLCSHCQVHRELAARRVWPGSTMRCVYSMPSGYTQMQ